MIKEIRANEIPEWEFGDVAIKTFSFGEKLSIAELKTFINKSGEAEDKDNISLKDISIMALSAGILWIKTKDNHSFFVKNDFSLEDKKKIVYNLEFEPAGYLLKQIYEINKPIDEELKKK